MPIKCNILDRENQELNDRYTRITPEEGVLTLPCWWVGTDGTLTNYFVVMGELVQTEKSIFESFPDEVEVYVDLTQFQEAGYIDTSENKNNLVECQLENVCLGHESEMPSIKVHVKVDGKRRFRFNVLVSVDYSSLQAGVFDQPCRATIRYGVNYEYKRGLKREFYRSDDECDCGLNKIDFFIHSGLKNRRSWIGLDPGTTGSCVCIGGVRRDSFDKPNILSILGENPLPSRIIIPQTTAPKDTPSQYLAGEDYYYGLKAQQLWKSELSNGSRCFSSIKKLLGYQKGKKVSVLMNGEKREFTGLDIAHLLIKGIEKETEEIINALSESEKDVYLGTDHQPVERMVVAIPNNYTLPKMMEMVESVSRLGKYKEIRCIYEPEAVLFNYLMKEYANIGKGKRVLVFDMGGATINVSLFDVRNTSSDPSGANVEVATLSRVGYAVGGDNIDFALIETLLDFYCDACGIGILDDASRETFERTHKNELLQEIFPFKVALIRAKDGLYSEMFANSLLFVQFLNRLFSSLSNKTKMDADLLEIALGVTGKMWEEYREMLVNRIVNSKQLTQYVFSRINEAIDDTCSFCAGVTIDNIIFSGRSILFPGVKETVLKSLNVEAGMVWDGLKDKEIKTAVAKGACWYGMFGTSVKIDNELIISTYGFRMIRDGRTMFIPIISPIDSNGNRNRFNPYKGEYESRAEVVSNFDLEGNEVDFYQVMGVNTDNVFDDNKKYKRNHLGTVDISQHSGKTKEIIMSVDRQDVIKADILFQSGSKIPCKMLSSFRDIFDDNDPAYLFATLWDTQVSQVTSELQTTPANDSRKRSRL